MQTDNNRLLVYLCGYGSFEKLLLMSAYFHLTADDESLVEVAVGDSTKFQAQYGQLIGLLHSRYPGRLHISQFAPVDAAPRATRFLQQPEWAEHATHVFIADVDVLTLDSNLFKDHLSLMAQRGVPFSNVLRPRESTDKGFPRLTGCHFSSKNAYYPVPDLSDIDIPESTIRGADENILYQIVKIKLNPVFQSRGLRPIHGIHVTPSRRPFGNQFRHLDNSENVEKIMASQASADHLGVETSFWQGVANPEYRRAFLSHWGSDVFREMYFMLESSVQQRLLVLKIICEKEYRSWQAEMMSRYLPYDLYSPAVLHARLKANVKRQTLQIPGAVTVNSVRKLFWR